MTAKRNCHDCDHAIGKSEDVVYCTKNKMDYHKMRAETCDDYRNRPFKITLQDRTPRCDHCDHKFLTPGTLILFNFGASAYSPYTTRTLCAACVEELKAEYGITDKELDDE